jgi:hypothetical protein
VHDAGAVRGGQRARDLGQDRCRVIRGEPRAGADQLGEVHALDVLHDQPLLAQPIGGVVADEVEDRDDVGVVELGGQLGPPARRAARPV